MVAFIVCLVYEVKHGQWGGVVGPVCCKQELGHGKSGCGFNGGNGLTFAVAQPYYVCAHLLCLGKKLNIGILRIKDYIKKFCAKYYLKANEI